MQSVVSTPHMHPSIVQVPFVLPAQPQPVQVDGGPELLLAQLLAQGYDGPWKVTVCCTVMRNTADHVRDGNRSVGKDGETERRKIRRRGAGERGRG